MIKYNVLNHLTLLKIQNNGFPSMIYNFFDKKSSIANTCATLANRFAGRAVKSKIISSQELAE